MPGGGHNDTWVKGGKDYAFAIKDFIDKVDDWRTQNLPTRSINYNNGSSINNNLNLINN